MSPTYRNDSTDSATAVSVTGEQKQFGALRLIALSGAAVALTAGPLFAGRFLPLFDLPQHLGLSAALPGLVAKAGPFEPYYEIDTWPVPYWTYYALVALLSCVVTIEIANKLVLTLYAVSIPIAAVFLLSAFGKDKRLTVLTLPLAWSTNLFWGFVSFLTSIPFFLLALGQCERILGRTRNTPVQLSLFGFVMVCVFFSHAQTYVLLILCIFILLWVHWRGVSWALARTAPLLPSALLFAGWVWRSFITTPHTQTKGDFVAYGRLWDMEMYWEPFVLRVATAMEQLFGGFADHSNRWLGWCWTAIILSGIAASLVTRPNEGADSSRSIPFRWRTGLLFGAVACAWLVLPYEVQGQWYIAPRFLIFAAALAPLLITTTSQKTLRWIIGAGAVLSIAFSWNVARIIVQFQQPMTGLAEVLQASVPGDRMASLLFDHRFHAPDPATGRVSGGRFLESIGPAPVILTGFGPSMAGAPEVFVSPTHHVTAYYQVWSGGDISLSFAAAPSIPVRYKQGRQANASPPEFTPEEVKLPEAAREFRWFLVWGSLTGEATKLPEYATRVAASGNWQLWQSHETIR